MYSYYCLEQKFNVKKKRKTGTYQIYGQELELVSKLVFIFNVQLTTAVCTSLRCFCKYTIQCRAYICLHQSALFCESTESICVRTLALGGLYATTVLGLGSKQLGFIMSPVGNGNQEHIAIMPGFFLLLACGSNVKFFFLLLADHTVAMNDFGSYC